MTILALTRTAEGRQLVQEKCDKHSLDMSVFEELIKVEVTNAGKYQKSITKDFDEIFDAVESE